MRALILTILATAALSGCGSLSNRDATILGGAVVGGAVGNLATDGSAIGTVGGAIVGGVVGGAIDDNSSDRARRADWQRRYDGCRRYNSTRYCDRVIK